LKTLPGLTLIVSAALLLGGGGEALAAPSGPNTQPAPVSGGRAAAQAVNLRALARGPQRPAHAWTSGPLDRQAKPAGAGLPTQSGDARKVAPKAPAWVVGGPNSILGPLPLVRHPSTPKTPPATTNSNFSGVSQLGSNCGGCQPPDTNDAVGLTQIVEAVNLRLQVYSKKGAGQCGIGLNTLLNTSSALTDPRVQYDNLNNRFSVVVTVVPTAGATPSLYVLASQTSNPCGSWWLYHMAFSGSLYPAGTLLDYPYLGQDRLSLLFSSNNFCCATTFGSYINSAAFSIAKSRVYSGAAVSFTSYPVAFSTAPVTVSGIPIAATTTTYFLAAVPGFGYDLYRMASSPNSPITLQAAISSPFTAPTRRVIQPGTSQTLDPLDGRIPWAPVQSQSYVWFAHGVNLAGYPAVRYGAISVLSNTAFAAVAFHSATSDDFNPSIGVADAGTNLIYAWVNWAYTDTPNNVATSDTINGVLPGTGVPNLIGTDRVLIKGFPTSSNFRFGDFSSVEVDPTAASGSCPAGRTAVTNQEFFTSNGNWATRLARLSFC
jgi:hypothetical protein